MDLRMDGGRPRWEAQGSGSSFEQRKLKTWVPGAWLFEGCQCVSIRLRGNRSVIPPVALGGLPSPPHRIFRATQPWCLYPEWCSTPHLPINYEALGLGRRPGFSCWPPGPWGSVFYSTAWVCLPCGPISRAQGTFARGLVSGGKLGS